jgi:ABC-type multidrug transport system fused ATPase/permease subunit
MIKICSETKKDLIKLKETKNILFEGNIAKMIDSDGDDEFKEYLNFCVEKDKETRRKRLEITKQVQNQNKELSELNVENERILGELQETLKNVEETKTQIEEQNKELVDWKDDNERLTIELKSQMNMAEQAKMNAERAKSDAENNLDVLQKKTQFELINMIVKIALSIILGVGLITTGLYLVSIFTGKETQIIGSTWSNMFGILLTNAFSIVGTIMGVKYATEKKD